METLPRKPNPRGLHARWRPTYSGTQSCWWATWKSVTLLQKLSPNRQSLQTKIMKIRCRELEEECSSTRTGRAEGQCRWLPSKECGFCGTCQTPAILTWFSAFRLLPLSQDEVGNTDDDFGAVDHSVEVQYANFYKERIPVLYYRWTKWTF